MKKSIFIFGISIILLSSRMKTYECECTQTAFGQTSISTAPIRATNKRDAKAGCETISSSGAGITQTCELK